MVAGFHIAKCILHKCGEDEDFKLFIDSNKGKFFGDKRHTLAEDIIKSLFYLVPIHYHKEWFEIMPNPEVINAAIDNLDIFLTYDKGRKSFIKILTGTECEIKIKEHLFDTLYEKVCTYNIAYMSSFLPFLQNRMEVFWTNIGIVNLQLMMLYKKHIPYCMTDLFQINSKMQICWHLHC